MRSLQILSSSAALLGGLASAVPTNNARDYNAPTDDGFPNPNQQQLSAIQETAGGQLPNGPPPSKLAPSTLTAFQLIAFNENFEVAFYSSLIDNITSEAPGYDNLDDQSMEEVLEVLETIKAVCLPPYSSLWRTETDSSDSKKNSTPSPPFRHSNILESSPLPPAPTSSPLATSSVLLTSPRPSMPSSSAPCKTQASCSPPTAIVALCAP